ncbi:MAG: hypothetical protein FWD61_18430 [Phycisphaerales bacterium]|nr:hypothetical protein [Phycisphaerales bacterium]
MNASLPQVLPGYRIRILDGNHLSATQRRIKELRAIWDAPLPGQILVILDPELMLVPDVILCQDGHSQERSMLGEVLQIVKEGELWIADRNFCTFDFLCGIESKQAAYLIRQHGKTQGELPGKAVARGQTSTGKEPPSEHISPRLAGMLNPAHACSHDNLLSLIDGLNWKLPVQNPDPELMQRIAKAFGVDPKTPPAFEDFLPLDLAPKKAGVNAKTLDAAAAKSYAHFTYTPGSIITDGIQVFKVGNMTGNGNTFQLINSEGASAFYSIEKFRHATNEQTSQFEADWKERPKSKGKSKKS